VFLLARCRSKTNDAPGANVILQSYLLEPKIYKWELKSAQTHKTLDGFKAARHSGFSQGSAKEIEIGLAKYIFMYLDD